MLQFLKFVLATVIGIFLTTILVIGIMAIIIKVNDKDVSIEPNSVLKMSLDNPIPDRSKSGGVDFSSLSVRKPALGLNDILTAIKKAKADDKIKGIYLELSSTPIGLAMMEEIRDALIDFKTADKFIISYSEVLTQNAYYMASVADKIYLNPQGSIFLKGYSAELMFFKGLLDKLGIDPEVFYVGNFKSATEPIRYEKMSEYNRLQIKERMDDVMSRYIKTIATARNMTEQQFFEIVDSLRIKTAEDAKTFKVVDDLFYVDQVRDDLKERLGVEEEEKIEFVSLGKYDKVPDPNKVKGRKKSKIAVIYAEGAIVSGKGDVGEIGSDTYVKAIREAREDEKTKAIILRINSGGGSALASEIMWRELKLAKDKGIPVIASMGNVAASGGYYMSCVADTILAEENTITGSIGVFGIGAELGTFFQDNFGITFDGVKTTTHSDFPVSPFINREFKESEKNIIQKGVNDIYDIFLQRVADGRNMAKEQVHAIAQGRVWTGSQAKENGLVDVIGGMDDAMVLAEKMAGLETGAYKVSSYPAKKDPLEMVMKEFGMAKTKDKILREELGTLYKSYKQLKELTKMKGVQARMPFDIEIH